tara:strand:+ start:4816 stop:5172 length:357 start_codon:yes stop_codon:yes gene_type:complete
MITYNWDCRTVDSYPQSGDNLNLVYNVHWRVTGVSEIEAPEGFSPDDTHYSSSNIGTQSLNVSNVVEFIPFEDLTNEQVVGWVKSAMGEEKVNSIEDSIASSIESLITPKSVTLIIKN